MAKKVGFLGVLLALALVLSYIESLIPFGFGVPGIKLGLTNLIIVILLYLMGEKEALMVSIARVFLAGFMFGTGFSIIYSLAGALFSFAIMCFLKRKATFKVPLVCVFGGLFHNLGQLIVAMIVVDNLYLAFYFPALLLSGVLTGLVIGILATELISRLKFLF